MKDLETKLCRHSQNKVVSVDYTKVYIKGVLKNDFVCVETEDLNLFYQLPSKTLIHQRDFSSEIRPRCLAFACCLISMLLYTIFKDFAFWSLCLYQIILILFYFIQSVYLKLLSAIFQFLKEHCVSWLFGRNTLKRNLSYSRFIFPLLHQHLFSPELARTACFLKTSCFEKITVCVIEALLLMLLHVQINKVWRKVSQQSSTNQAQMFLNKSSTVLKTCLNDWKKISYLFSSCSSL